MKKLAIIILGNRHSGKSSTFYKLFGRRIKTGYKQYSIKTENLRLFVKNSSFEEMGETIDERFFVRNSSFEECNSSAQDYFDEKNLPKVILCAVQYTEKGLNTMNYFKEQGYYLYIQWLNPGFKDKEEYDDFLSFENQYSKYGEFHKVSGKEKDNRVADIEKFIYKWIVERKSLLQT